MISPFVDVLLVGGLSLIVFVPLLLTGRTDLVFIGAGAQAWLATLVNMPHFMASYRIIYRSKEMILRHKWASIYVPIILVFYTAFAVWEAKYSPALVIVLVAVSSMYLAWHYTGQVWGMMASYAYLDGTSFDKTERLLIRTSLRFLLAWQVSWFLYYELRNREAVKPFYIATSAGIAVAFVLGVIGIAKMRARTGKLPPARALVAWLALFAWYGVMARDPKAIFWVQIAHAVQYLAFPIRVEINRTNTSPRATPQRLAFHMVLYAGGLLAASYLVGVIVPGQAMSVLGDIYGEEPGKAAPLLILMFVNFHHFFTDGVIWKISDPEVRNELFAHVPRPKGGGSKQVAGTKVRGAS